MASLAASISARARAIMSTPAGSPIRQMKRLEKKHPLAIRWFHWINFPVLALMIWSGLLIYWANDVYRVGVGGLTLFHFFPGWFYSLFTLDGRLAEGMAWHFLFMWLFVLNGIAYVTYTLVSGEWRYLVPNRHSFREAMQVTLYDLHLAKTAPPPRKFNGAQQIAYTAIVLMGVGSLVTGLAIYKPTQLAWLDWLFGGYPMARIWHFCLTIGYVLFFVVHIAQVIRAGWNNFRAMVTGFEVIAVEEASAVPAEEPCVILVEESSVLPPAEARDE
jgi:thiosulfate reductase cytochrome b subunit